MQYHLSKSGKKETLLYEVVIFIHKRKSGKKREATPSLYDSRDEKSHLRILIKSVINPIKN